MLIKSAMFFMCPRTQIKWIRKMNIQRQEYIKEVPKVIECILAFCVIAEVEVLGKVMGEHYQSTCFVLMVLPNTSTTAGHTMLLLQCWPCWPSSLGLQSVTHPYMECVCSWVWLQWIIPVTMQWSLCIHIYCT